MYGFNLYQQPTDELTVCQTCNQASRHNLQILQPSLLKGKATYTYLYMQVSHFVLYDINLELSSKNLSKLRIIGFETSFNQVFNMLNFTLHLYNLWLYLRYKKSLLRCNILHLKELEKFWQPPAHTGNEPTLDIHTGKFWRKHKKYVKWQISDICNKQGDFVPSSLPKYKKREKSYKLPEYSYRY